MFTRDSYCELPLTFDNCYWFSWQSTLRTAVTIAIAATAVTSVVFKAA